MSQETIIYESKDSIAYLKINRPERMNSFRLEEFDMLIRGIMIAEQDPQVKVIKIFSEGFRAFSGGLDLGMIQELATSQEKIPLLLKMGEEVVRTFYKTRKPIVVQVQGAAVGWGAILCLISDFVIAGDNPKTFFSLNEIDVGIFPGTGALSVALLNTGLKNAKRLLLVPEKIYLNKAEQFNLVTKIVSMDQLNNETDKFCENLATKLPNVTQPVKGILNFLHMKNIEKMFSLERDGFDLFMKDNFQDTETYFEKVWAEL